MTMKKILAAMLVASLAATAMVSCGKKETESSSTPESSKTESSDAASTDEGDAEPAGVTYPLEGDNSITYWLPLNSNVSAGSASMNDTPLKTALDAATGITVEYIHPAQGTEQESLNLLLSSGELPDIVETTWVSRAGGPELAFKSKQLVALNEHMAAWAPDYTAYLEANPDIDKMVRTDEGNYFGFPFIRGAEELMVFYGPIVRQDWLEELGIEEPTTIAEWYDMLTAFKNEKGATAPLTQNGVDLSMFDYGSPFVGAYGVTLGFSLNDAGEIIYGPVQPEFKEFLAEMAKWYAEGLIDPNFYTNDRATWQANMLNDLSGATVGYSGSGIGTLLPALQEVTPTAELAGTKYPSLVEGENAPLGQKDTPFMSSYQVAGVTPSGNEELAFKFLNFGYTEAGTTIYNFGVEGESYTMVDGEPIFVEAISEPGEGKSMAQAMAQYTRSCYSGPFVQALGYYEQYMKLDVQKEAIADWKEHDSTKYALPPITPTEDESKEFATIQTNMNAWRNEWVIGAITGANSLDDFDAFVAEMENIGLSRALEIQEAALERYNNR